MTKITRQGNKGISEGRQHSKGNGVGQPSSSTTKLSFEAKGPGVVAKTLQLLGSKTNLGRAGPFIFMVKEDNSRDRTKITKGIHPTGMQTRASRLTGNKEIKRCNSFPPADTIKIYKE